MTDSPGSPLSSIASEDISDRDDAKQSLLSPMPPSKRRRTNIDRNTPVSTTYQDGLHAPASPASSISSDTSGEVTNSPTTLALLGSSQEDDYSGQGNDQVTACRWEGCDAGDLGNMDELVFHIHNDHIGSRQKKYSCEWADCNRKGQTHASGYALRAHMRSHTREKPFFCSLPECDRSFTRSDALTKHMRTVHETEALRPSDPMPKGHNASLPVLAGPAGGGATPASKLQRIKLKLSHPPREEADRYSESTHEDHTTTTIPEDPLLHLQDPNLEIPEYGPETGFDDHELALPPRDLYRLLRRQIHWAERESNTLRYEWERTLRPKRKHSWLEKEAIFDDVIDAEVRLFGAIVRSQGLVPATAPPPGTADNGLERYQYQQRQHAEQLQGLEEERRRREEYLRQQEEEEEREQEQLEQQQHHRERERERELERQEQLADGKGKLNVEGNRPSTGFVIPRPAGDI